MRHDILRKPPVAVAAISFIALAGVARPTPAQTRSVDEDVIARIKIEGFQRSQVMDTAFHLSAVYGPRLHGSPNYEKAARWSRDRLAGWGLSEAKLETWDSPVPGWSVRSHSVELTAPSYARLIAYPMAWSPSIGGGSVEGIPIVLSITTERDLDPYRGKLENAIVLNGLPEPLAPRDVPSGRFSREALDAIEEAIEPGSPRDYFEELAEWNKELATMTAISKRLRAEGVAAVLYPSSRTRGVVRVSWSGTFGRDESPPGFVVAREHYHRVARLVQKGLEPRLKIQLESDFIEDAEGYNVLAELPGATDEVEVVLFGAHLDSWHSGTGATDNAAGCAVMMEALRILKAIDARPKRTIRLGLWGGEEQAYWGSRYHVESHYSDLENRNRKPGYDRLSAYYNLDTGTGRIRGIYLQGNEKARPILERFLAPFAYLGAASLTTQNTSGTDHLLFDAVGLPAFTFIQDPQDYDTFTHHTNMDVYDYLVEEDLKQAAVVIAAVVYATAMMDEKMPRKLSSGR